jgi:hypothetical protein
MVSALLKLKLKSCHTLGSAVITNGHNFMKHKTDIGVQILVQKIMAVTAVLDTKRSVHDACVTFWLPAANAVMYVS